MVEITERRLATARRRAVAHRNYRRARERALTRLARLYPDDYQRLLAEERERDLAEGKIWLDLSGSVSDSLALNSENRNTRPDKTHRNQQPEGNL